MQIAHETTMRTGERSLIVFSHLIRTMTACVFSSWKTTTVLPTPSSEG
jgi:hypothetical protein